MLLDKAPSEELDYGFVMGCLKAYKNPRVKLNHLLRIHALVRVKRGIYIFGKNFARRPYSSISIGQYAVWPLVRFLRMGMPILPPHPRKGNDRHKRNHSTFKAISDSSWAFHLQPPPLTELSSRRHTNSFFRHTAGPHGYERKSPCRFAGHTPRRVFIKKTFCETLFEDLRIEEEDLENLNLDLLKEIYQARPHSAIHYLLQWRQAHA